MAKIGVGIYGSNGHQIHRKLADHPRAQLVAAAACGDAVLETNRVPVSPPEGPRVYDDLEGLLSDERVQLVSLCSPRRADQAADAVRCLEAGRHVYAEKPCAMSKAELDRIIETSRRTGRRFHEMAGTAFGQPYAAMSRIVREGRIGQVVQVLVQKSYPYHDRRPQDEAVDGGLVMQVGVHAARMIEQVAGARVESILAIDTRSGNPHKGELRMAAGMVMRLAGGGVGCIVANYLNQRGSGVWGNDHLRIFGTRGFVESMLDGKETRLVVGEKDFGTIDTSEPGRDYFEMFLDELLGQGEMPISLDDELYPTRVVLRARQSAMAGGTWIGCE